MSFSNSTFCRGHVNSSTPTFDNINLTKAVIHVIIVVNSIKNGCKNIYLQPRSFKFTLKSKSVNQTTHYATLMCHKQRLIDVPKK